MSDTKELGRRGEQLTAEYLENRGFCIAARNWHSRYGEIDLIAENADYLLFVEVKLRSSSRFSAPREAVTPAKMEKIRKTALIYLSEHETPLQPRFDVAEVSLRGESAEIEYFEDAFQ